MNVIEGDFHCLPVFKINPCKESPPRHIWELRERDFKVKRLSNTVLKLQCHLPIFSGALNLSMS